MDIPAILAYKYPNDLWRLEGDDYDGLTWLSESPKPSEEDLRSAWPEVSHARAIRAVESARASAYRETADPLFFQWQRGEVTEAEWLAAVEAVKTAHPYPEEVE
jgi:hypothetical protein